MSIHFDFIKSLIEKYGKNSPQYVWTHIYTIEELFYCNKEFIKNNLTESFYHYGELCPDSKILEKYLLELHDYGIFTYGGQGNTMIYDKESIIEYEIKCGKRFYSMEQKPFLECMVKLVHVDKLLNYISLFNNNIIDEQLYYIIVGNDINHTNITQRMYNVTREKKYNELSQKDIILWNDYTNLWTDIPFDGHIFIFDKYKNLYDIIYNEYFVLNLTTKNYGSQIILEKVLLDFIKQTNSY